MAENRDWLLRVGATLLGGTAVADLAGYPLGEALLVGIVAALSFLDPILGEVGGVLSEYIFGIDIVPGLLEAVSYLIEQAAASDMLLFVVAASGTVLILRAVGILWHKRSSS
ncbi:hypothetical protein [Natronorubrum sp. FCH18a]|uniref:hypothetical protein n=1 Tax=Natronorubrum sp. FCH18a TaxID=3447018 RepID=UPI003F517B3D